MDDDNLRIRAMDFAIAARASQHEDIVELAQRIYAFLDPHSTLTAKGAEALKAHVDEIQSEQCIPPIPQQDLGKADQSPKSYGVIGFNTTEARYGGLVVGQDGQIQSYRPLPDALDASDTPTRIVRTVA